MSWQSTRSGRLGFSGN